MVATPSILGNVRPLARFLAPDGRSELLGPGDIIGRMPTATLTINDPHVSEAHALVSLRGSELKLPGLRGRSSVLEVAPGAAR